MPMDLKKKSVPSGNEEQTVLPAGGAPLMPPPGYGEDAGQEAPQRSMVWSFFRPIVIFLVAALIVWIIVDRVTTDVRTTFFDPVNASDTTAVEVVIPKGASLSQISDILYENNLIRSKQVFKFYTDFSDNASKLKAGTYTLSRSMSFDDIIYELRQNTDVAPTSVVTLPEGLTILSFADLLTNGDVTDSLLYQQMCQSGAGAKLPQALVNSEVNLADRRYALEGYLFPDTYEFYRQSSPEDVVNRQLARFNEVITEEHLARAEELGMTFDEVVILASLIERESKAPQFAQVSAVFHNRLEEGMPLQSDASVSYGLGITNRINLTAEELETDTPYNTYMNAGLPVGPIGNPGLAAIEAVLYPDQELLDEGYLYFALTDPATGELVFSRTFDEHQAVVDQWQSTWEEWDQQGGQGGQ